MPRSGAGGRFASVADGDEPLSRTVTGATATRPGPPCRGARPTPMPASGNATSLSHMAGLVRATIPPMHPGGRPIVAGVAAAAGLARLLTGRGALLGALAT